MTSKIIADMVDTIETRDRELAALREAQTATLDAAERMAKAIDVVSCGPITEEQWHELMASAAAFREMDGTNKNAT